MRGGKTFEVPSKREERKFKPLNAFVEKGSGIGNTFSDLAPTLRIDNIFSDPRFHVNQYIRIKKKLSDHYPIVADLVY